MNFTHLRTQSAYSLKNSIIDIEDMVDLAAESGMDSVAVADTANLFGVIKFYEKARSKGIKPIVGAEIAIESDIIPAQKNKIVLLCKNNQGYKNLCHLISKAQVQNNINETPIIKKEWLDGKTDGLILLSGGVFGEIGQGLISGKEAEAKKVANDYKRIFKDDFLIELQRHDYAGEVELVEKSVDLASKLDIPVVATHPVQFADRKDYVAHEVKTCILSKDTLDDENRTSKFSRDQYFKTADEMTELFSDIPEAIQNTQAVLKKCSTEIELGKAYFPKFETPNGQEINQYFKVEARAGLVEKLNDLFPDKLEREKKKTAYEERLEFELAMIEKMGFVSYFLVVSDFMKWSKENDVPVGPGRGSGAGSLVAYALKITDVDPLKFDLLFERFINPERVSLPDFDIDFCQDKREETIEYVKKKYGEESVCQIATFNTMATRAVLRDVGRVLQYNYNFVDQIVKLIPSGSKNLNITLAEAIEKEPKLKQKIETDADVKKLFKYAQKLEGLPKGVSVHAGGVLISPTTVEAFSPLYVAEAGIVSQYDKVDIEKAGLIKFDFLGLKNLTIIDQALKKIQQTNPSFDLKKLPLNDQKSLDIVSKGNTVGIFQVAEQGMTSKCVKMGIDRFEDLADILALYRPGPIRSGMVDEFISRKHGLTKTTYVHPKLEKILKTTHGVIVYQEQVMQIAQDVAGYTLGGADLLRRAMGKKKPEEMAKLKESFVAGSVKNSQMTEKAATDLFELIEKFAEYGFNKSHSVAYAFLAYQTAYLKANYPKEYFQALFQSDLDNTDSLAKLVVDAKKNNITVFPPDINKSGHFFEIEPEGIRYSLTAIKKVGEPLVRKIEKVRKEKGDFTSFEDMCAKVGVGAGAVSKLAAEALIRGGAFDSIDPRREVLIAMVEPTLDAFKKIRDKKKKSALSELFSSEDQPISIEPIPVPEVKAWSTKERMEQEKIAIGFYLTDNPFREWIKPLKGINIVSLSDLDKKDDGDEALSAGLITAIREHIPKSGKGKMAFIQISDGDATKDVTIFPRQYEYAGKFLKEGEFLAVNIAIQKDKRDEEKKVYVANEVYTHDGIQCAMTDKIHISMNMQDFTKLRPIIQNHHSEEGTQIVVYHPEKNGDGLVKVPLNQAGRVSLSTEVLAQMREAFGEDKVKITYTDLPPAPKYKSKM